ncbi:MAG: hypothetical protein RL646_408 [Verrucomicrobiota bacterium]|jgi:hypothetical protein
MRALLLAVATAAAACFAQNAPADPPYPRPTVDPTKDVKEPEPPAAPEPERKKTAKERKLETKKTKK